MKKTADYLYAAATCAKPRRRPMNIVGPYSKWPQKTRGLHSATTLSLLGGTFAGGVVVHCVLPVLA